MFVLDVNVVVAVHREDHPLFGIARPFYDDLVATREPFGTPDSVWESFVRISTNRRIFPVPTPVEEAFSFVRAVCGQPGHRRVVPGERHLDVFEELCRGGDATGDLVPDAALAAICVEHGCTIATFDRDFARFPGLSWRVPGGE